MSANHAQANPEIILVLSKMGIYMERDRTNLDALSPSAQNTRLRKALDRGLDNCCIFQLLFAKELREMGKLESAMVQGASVRLKDDVPEMEGLLLQWLGLATAIDIQGVDFPGGSWSLSTGSLSEARAAASSVQDIDTAENESEEPEMKREGYRGNHNRRAIPIIVVRYATGLPSLGAQKNVKSLIDFARLTSMPGSLTPTQLVMFSRILESNNRRLSAAEVNKYQGGVAKHIQKETKISFISPVYCPGANVADQIEIGRRPRLSCAVCDVEQGPDVKLSFCAACSGVAYCSSNHQSADWPSHKAICRSKKAKIPTAIRRDPARPSSPIVKVLLRLDYRSESESWGPRRTKSRSALKRYMRTGSGSSSAHGGGVMRIVFSASAKPTGAQAILRWRTTAKRCLYEVCVIICSILCIHLSVQASSTFLTVPTASASSCRNKRASSGAV
ncbi:hypothetical protein DFH07DRAFT_1060641 [Mycena maculata]|uniref:MYND-type domain-containing protein n=1 Tax=Mycena maculata TaxID=230809 RepID=A0AAD7NE89_9AGAR|nr:hypothetical protein DFH07DRAFT_1060641 [Mycena maculata]